MKAEEIALIEEVVKALEVQPLKIESLAVLAEQRA